MEDDLGYGKNVYNSTFENPSIRLIRSQFATSQSTFWAQYYRDVDASQTLGDFDDMLNELSTIARVSGSKAGPELSNAVGTLRIALANNIFFIIIIMLTLISLIFQNIYTHFINRKREVAIEYIN